MPQIYCITGGIGSGKSSLADLLTNEGFFVYNSDIRAKELMTSSPELIAKIKSLLGEEAYNNNTLNRAYIANKVFNNKSLLTQLNALVHPEVHKDFEKWKQKHFEEKFLFKEVAILFESGAYKSCDKIILVTADEDIRINRIIKRDNITEEQVKERIRNQWTEDQKINLSDYIIFNNGTLDIFIKTAKKELAHIFIDSSK